MSFSWGGRQFGPGQEAQFRAWLKAHGGNYATWAQNHPAAATTFAPPATRAAVATATAEAQPTIIPLLAAQKKAQADAQQLLVNNQGFTAALAKLYAGIAPIVSGTYQGAASEQGALGKGFGSAANQQAADQTAGADALFAKAGTPDAAAAAANSALGGPVGDVTYGLGGFIPASSLNREGAAFTSAAAQLPAYAGGVGQQNARSIAHDAVQQNTDLETQIAAARAGIPAEAERILEQERQDAIAREANQAQIDYLHQQTRSEAAGVTGFDPVTGQPTAAMQQFWGEQRRLTLAANATLREKKAHDKATLAAATAAGLDPDPALSGKYGYIVDHHGNPIVGPDGGRIPVYTKPAAAKKTSTAGVKARETAFASAQKAIYSDASGLVSTRNMTEAEQDAYYRQYGHYPAGEAATVTIRPTYAHAKQQLFHKYDYLLRYATRKTRYQLKARLNTLLDTALAQYGIYPPGSGEGKPNRPGTN